MIQVKVKNLTISNFGFVTLLESMDEKHLVLPVFIGAPEAQAIALTLNNVKVPRPLTHDLLKNIMDITELRLKRVVINDLKEGTFYAKLIIAFGNKTIEVDARPSDSIALALRVKVPIFVEQKVMDEAGVILNKDGKIEKPPHEEHKSADPLLRLKAELERAIKEERYEDAARIRDEIKKATSSN